ncbi:MAG: sigma-54-dependent Fis family transcriptional regulator [Deltaproteobacteria bacterium]|nr:MAG: sigma-54-dependent Fis family transcriptional regulator [Deltaproteobacteria bacterium]
MGSILVVDDERSMRDFLAICLEREGHEVATAATAAEALAAATAQPPDVIVTDLKMPGDLDGIGLIEAARERGIDAEVIVVTAFATPETAIAALKKGAYDYLTKPFKVDEINVVIGRALEKRALVRENLALREAVESRHRFASLLSKSPQMQRVFDLVRKIHSTRTSVLITGESGTGKELVARALHSEGARKHGPFVAINCGAIPPDLLESELFGHVRGAFTGAVDDKPGLFEAADGGTLFLDEVGELPAALQVKLLRVLQERRVKPVGATREREIDVRVVAATNRDLEEEVARGAFRQDLYYRLNVIEIRLPPLRQRREDIPMLVDHFVRRFAAEQNKRIAGVSKEAMRRLQAYDYPGNVRELENVIERAVALSDRRIEVDALPDFASQPRLGVADGQAAALPADGIDLDAVLRDYERQLIERALAHTGGNRKRAAELLGISFRSLRYRLSKLGIGPADDDM